MARKRITDLEKYSDSVRDIYNTIKSMGDLSRAEIIKLFGDQYSLYTISSSIYVLRQRGYLKSTPVKYKVIK